MSGLLKTFLSLTAEYKIVHIQAPPSATMPQEKDINVYFWGLSKPTLTVENCKGNGFSLVIIRRKPLHILISLLTLGIISPITIIWQCAKDNCIRENRYDEL